MDGHSSRSVDRAKNNIATASDPAPAATVARMIQDRARHDPFGIAFRFLADNENTVELTYGELERQARAIAAVLAMRTIPGERALLQVNANQHFITAFAGCLYAGVIAVPAPVPHRNRPIASLLAIVADCAPAIVLTTTDVFAHRNPALAEAVGDDAWVMLDQLPLAAEPADGDLAPVTPDSLAFLQYTSGSTGAPKGVMVSHANLMHNQAMIRDACGHDSSTVVVGWLPLFHDMGLIGNVLQPVYLGVPCTLMAPALVLQKPLRWLQAISRLRATISGGPNFIYDLCTTRITAEQAAGLDLSSWQVAFNGAEPVRADTLERFAARFAAHGFRASAFQPCYGLAEATLRVLGPPSPATPVVLSVSPEALERGEAVAALPGTHTRRVVGCGPVGVFHGVTTAIVDPQSHQPLPPGGVGEIWIAGPNVAQGYWDRPEVTEHTFRAHLSGGAGPYLRTGDLGFVANDELFVTGRLKDMIVVRGRNLYPQDIERIVQESHPALEADRGAAFLVDVGDEDRLVVAQEIRPSYRLRLDQSEVRGAIRSHVAAHFGLGVYRVILLGPGGLPRTSSGKIRRSMCRDQFFDPTWPVIPDDQAAW